MSSLSFIRIALTVALSSLCLTGQIEVRAQQSGVAPAKSDTPGTGLITGRVVNEGGQPLPDAVVMVRAAGSSGFEQAIGTDREGTFRVNGLDPSLSYYVSAVLPAYTPPPTEPTASPTPYPTYKSGASVTLTLVKGGVITGTVTNAAGEPIVGIRVRALRVLRLRNGRRLPNGETRERETDDRGVYRIYGLAPGNYLVSAGGAGNSYSSAIVDPYDTDVPTYAPESTRDTASEISVLGGEETSGIDIRYRAEQGHTVSGVIGGPTGVVSTYGGFNVTLTLVGDGGVPWSGNSYPDMNGRSFSFNGLADGDYDLYAVSYGQNRELGVSEVKRIRLRGADLTGIELMPRTLPTVAGRVVFEEVKPPVCTEKSQPSFDAMTVGAWHNATEAAKETPQSIWSLGVPVKPDSQGNFLVRNLAPAEYYFAARGAPKNWYVRSVQFLNPAAKKPIDATRVWTNVKTGDQLSGLTFTLAPGGASFRGQLALGDGEKVPENTFVYVVPTEQERAENTLNYYGMAVTPENKIAINNIAPGRYWIFAETLGDDGLSTFSRTRFPHETEMRARIRRTGEAAKTEIEFKPCQEVVDFKIPLKPRDQ